jgi:hypothetical protein
MQKKLMTEYDSTKNMLNTLRKLNESKQTGTLREQSQEQRISNDTSTFPKGEEQPSTESMKNDLMVINDVEVKIMSGDNLDMKLMDDQKKSISGIIDNFKQQVSQIVEFEPGFTISPSQIRLDGTLTDDDVSFVFISGDESGLYINADMLKLDSEVMIVIDKLVKFEPTFKTAMEPLISQRNNN